MKISKIIFFLFFSISIIAQTKLSKKQIDSLPNTIDNQFIKIYKKSSSWHEYKMIKRVDFVSFQKKILDSVSIIKKDVITKQASINEQKNTIASLNEKISNLNNNLAVSTTKENNIHLFGAQMKKSFYNTILWGIILLLLAGLVFFIYKFNNSNSLTKKAALDLAEIEEASDLYRKKAIEKEQKLRRQLQDEINKQRGI